MTDDPVFSRVDTCRSCDQDRRIAVTESGRKRCHECYLGVENPWDWGIVFSKRGRIIHPDADDHLHNKENQRDLLHGGGRD